MSVEKTYSFNGLLYSVVENAEIHELLSNGKFFSNIYFYKLTKYVFFCFQMLRILKIISSRIQIVLK